MRNLLLGAVIAVWLSGCGEATNDPLAGEVTAIEVEANETSMYSVGAIQMSARAFYTRAVPERKITENVTWSSSNTTIATVNFDGLVFGGSGLGGSVTISGNYHQYRDETTIEVVGLSDIELTAAETNLTQEQTVQIHAVGTFEDGTERNVTDSVFWYLTAENDTNATVEQNGTLYTGDANGTLEVNTTFFDFNDSIEVYVSPVSSGT